MERAGEEPLLSTALFRNRVSNLGLITQNVQWLLLLGTAFVVSAYLQVVRGYNAIQTGVIFTAATGGILASSLAAERLAKKYAQRTLIIAGFVATLAGIVVLLALVNGSPSVWAFAPGLLLIGLGVGVMLTPSVNVVQSSFPEDRQGEISGLSRSVSNLGSCLGTAIGGTILVSGLTNHAYGLAMSRPGRRRTHRTRRRLLPAQPRRANATGNRLLRPVRSGSREPRKLTGKNVRRRRPTPARGDDMAVTHEIEPGRLIDLTAEVVGLDRSDRLARIVEQQPGRPPRRIDGLTIGAPQITGDAPHDGEMHPDGDELLYLISGAVTVTLELPDGAPPGRARRGRRHRRAEGGVAQDHDADAGPALPCHARTERRRPPTRGPVAANRTSGPLHRRRR